MMRWLVLGLVLAASPVFAAEPPFDVVDHDVRVVPDYSAHTISGTQVVRFRSLVDGLDTISFSANSLRVVASIDGAAMVTHAVEGDRLVFRLPAAMRRGQVGRLVLTFDGAAPKGLVFAADAIHSTYFTCDYMICDLERPGDKATITMSLRVPDGFEAIAPGTMSKRASGGWVTWRETRELSAYLFGFAVGRYQRVTLAGGPPSLSVLTQSAPAGKTQAMFANTGRMLSFFEEKAGVRFPGAAYTQVLVPGSAAQEAGAHATIGLDDISPILEDPHEDWVVAHELAHQWWGNAVTCRDWSELWLNEGLVVFMVAAYKEERWGRADYDRELALANKRWSAAKEQGFDVPLSWKGAYPSLKLKRAMAYAKAVVFLDLLRRELGEDAFWRAVRIYTKDNWDGVVTAADLKRAIERASGRDLSELFRQWVGEFDSAQKRRELPLPPSSSSP